MTEYSVKKHGDNFALCFRGEIVEVFATRKTANKWKEISEYERARRGEVAR